MQKGVFWWLALLWVLVVTGCGSGATMQPETEAPLHDEPTVLDYNFGTDPLVLDPAFVNNRSSVEVVAQLFEGLTTLDPESAEPVPALATEWDVSEDGLTYTFKMRGDAFWVNQAGEPQGPVTADDVVYAIKRVCHPDSDAPLKQTLFVIKGCQEVNQTEGIPDIDSVAVRAVEQFIVEFALSRPAPYFPAILALPVAWPVPRGAVEGLGAAWSEPEQLLSDGPYLLTDLVPGTSLVLERNPAYYDALAVRIGRVNGYLVEDDVALTLYEANRLDTTRVPPSQVQTLLGDAQLTHVPEPCTVAYGFTSVKSPVDSVRVRRALSYAIDREWLVANVLGKGAMPARTFAPPTTFDVPPAGTSTVMGDAAQAQRTLSEAGYPEGQGLPPIRLLHPEGDEHARVAAAVADMWRSTLHIDVTVEARPREAYLQTIERTTLLEEAPHVWLLSWCGDYPDEHNWVYDLFHLGDATLLSQTVREDRERITVRPGANHVRRAPGDFDELLEQTTTTLDPAERQELYAEAEQFLTTDEVMLVPLYHYTSTILTKPWLTRTFFSSALSFKDWTIDMREKRTNGKDEG
ncbi:MAG: peptide ABC transporter substrate-binding protein [Chloroflexota bacterium]|nr:peptide ABC transporter substrate-binding protein [Chloroflexota bacterium]